MEIKKLLYVTEFEELWFDALQSLMVLREAGLNQIVFLYIIDRDEVAMHRGIGYNKSEEVKLKEIANIRFIDWAEDLFMQGIEVNAHIVVGKKESKIVAVSEEENVDLIVTEYHQKKKLQEYYEGSTLMEVIRRSSKPVMVHKFIHDSGGTNNTPFKRPLLTLDWSPASDKAIEFIICIKNIVEKVLAVHVVNEKSLDAGSSMEVQKIRKENRKKLDKVCDLLVSHGIEAESHLYIGDTIPQIERAAFERNATIIIGGTTGRETIKERFLGSVPIELSKKSGFPTLFVPPELRE